ncbi:hypothetical protein EV702DRAFT_1200705 [Suillus placidus]|uniref:Uncharacterized protein n=1 Tax=Suillus placidus TaxID=48579 RepID=A0A9P6ZNQ3_9AGAM|nr:hypothetical protein EV702DRAFT_1200705 [Suillus placidus]
MAHTCRGCRREFDSRGALSTHKRSCSSKIADVVASSLAKRRHDREIQQAVKIRRREEAEVDLMARQDMRESFAEPELPPDPGPRSPSPPATYRLSGLPNRRRRLPKRFRDDLPPIPVVASLSSTSDDANAEQVEPMDSQPPIPVVITTPRDHYGVYRQYIHSLPSFNPDNLTSVAHLADSPTFTKNPDSLGARQWWSGFGRSTQAPSTNYFAPFLNATTCRLMSWFYSGSITKSLAELDRLVNEVILAADFDRAELKDFGALKESNRLDNYQGDAEDVCSSFSASDGWIETGVKIRIPADGVRHATEDAAPLFEVPGLFYRKPLEVIKAAFRESAAEHFHLMPFNMFYQPSDDIPVEKIYGEIYNSPAMLAEH